MTASRSQRLEGLARQLGVADRIDFVGFTDEVEKYLRASDIFVLPSASEGLSNSLLEAMATGLPAVVTPVLDNEELRVEGPQPLTIAMPGDADCVGSGTHASRQGQRASTFDGGRRVPRLIRSRLTIQHTADKLVTAYAAVMGSVRRRSGE